MSKKNQIRIPCRTKDAVFIYWSRIFSEGAENMNQNVIHTFLGANSAEGFHCLYNGFLQNHRNFIIKGGPGSGKSGLMKKAAQKAIDMGYFTELCHCSSDAESLDAVRIPELNLCILDGTPPHTAEPKFPGAKDDILNTGAFWNRTYLEENAEEIRELNGKISACFTHAYRYLAAAGKGAEDLSASFLRKTDVAKMKNFALAMVRRHIGKGSGTGEILPRFLSAITPQGKITHTQTLSVLCEKIFPVADPYRISEPFFDVLIENAVALGHSVYVFFDPLCPSVPRQIAIPTAKTAFAVTDEYGEPEGKNAYTLHLSRFCSPDKELKERYKSGAMLIRTGINEAIRTLQKEKAYHDELEAYYVKAMDFRKLNAFTQNLLRALFPKEEKNT